jgi:carboxyl-terminal processing protease
MKRSARRLGLPAAFLILAGSVAGGLLGPRVRAEQRPEDELWTFGQILALVEDQYVGELDTEKLVEAAIEGMLGSLDPHSNYLGPESFAEMRDEQRGRFHGLGIQITKRGPDKPLTIIAPIDDTPASRAGLLSGDIISEIEGEATIDLTVQEAVRRLKGDRGTKVTITIQRPGLDAPFDVTIERDEIPIQSLRVAYMIEGDTGVIRIANFTNTTASELDAAMNQLGEQGMKRLVLDLRGNPGGLLDQAVQVAERYLPEDKLVVYTRGRIPGANQDFVARGRDSWLDIPLIVLVDHSSASASEIVSGAIQDHDRGLVVGETTFGKGLVQRVIPLRSGGALAVTTAKYYTPAGRLIQRDYTDLDDYYLRAMEAGDGDGDEPAPEGPQTPDDVIPMEQREVFYTASGRKVYGGGGITPDYIVKSSPPSDLLARMRRDNLMFDYAVAFVAGRPELSPAFEIDETILADYRGYLGKREFQFEEAEFESDRAGIALRLKAQIARIKWDAVSEARIIAEADPQIQRALELFGEAEQLARKSRSLDEEPSKKRRNDLRAELPAL